MIKCNIKRGGLVRVKASGTYGDLIPETAMMIKVIYGNIREANPEAAMEYKNRLLGLMLDPNSPVWKEDNHGD